MRDIFQTRSPIRKQFYPAVEELLLFLQREGAMVAIVWKLNLHLVLQSVLTIHYNLCDKRLSVIFCRYSNTKITTKIKLKYCAVNTTNILGISSRTDTAIDRVLWVWYSLRPQLKTNTRVIVRKVGRYQRVTEDTKRVIEGQTLQWKNEKWKMKTIFDKILRCKLNIQQHELH